MKYRITGTLYQDDGRMYAVMIDADDLPRETRVIAEVKSAEQAQAIIEKMREKEKKEAL
jgi:uncharacterized protein (UPF0128 family)